MRKVAKPLVFIVIAVGLAAGAAVYLSHGNDQPVVETSAPAHVTIRNGHIRGKENAPVTLVEFGDYQCPSCGAYHPFVKEILNRYPDKVKLDFHHYPLVTIHRNALAAAKAAEAAGEQGRFWEMHDALYEAQTKQMQFSVGTMKTGNYAWPDAPDPTLEFTELAREVGGINLVMFRTALDSPKIQERILQDVALGDQLQIAETPTFFINGDRVHLNRSIEDFMQAVESHLPK